MSHDERVSDISERERLAVLGEAQRLGLPSPSRIAMWVSDRGFQLCPIHLCLWAVRPERSEAESKDAVFGVGGRFDFAAFAATLSASG